MYICMTLICSEDGRMRWGSLTMTFVHLLLDLHVYMYIYMYICIQVYRPRFQRGKSC